MHLNLDKSPWNALNENVFISGLEEIFSMRGKMLIDDVVWWIVLSGKHVFFYATGVFKQSWTTALLWIKPRVGTYFIMMVAKTKDWGHLRILLMRYILDLKLCSSALIFNIMASKHCHETKQNITTKCQGCKTSL